MVGKGEMRKIWYNMRMGRSVERSGQAMVEYVLVLCAVLLVAAAVWHLARAGRAAADRTTQHVASDYP